MIGTPKASKSETSTPRDAPLETPRGSQDVETTNTHPDSHSTEARIDQWTDLPSVFDRDEDGAVVFKLAVTDPMQLFQSVDPASLAEKSLDSGVEEYLTDALESLGLSLPLRIEINLPHAVIATPEAQVIPIAMANYFHYRALQKKRALRKTFSSGRWSLLVSMVFLSLCLALKYGLSKLFELSTKTEWMTEFSSSALDIAAWVALWEPVNQLLHAWRPIRHEYKLYLKLRDTEIRLRESQQQEEDDTIRMQMSNLPQGVDIHGAFSRPGFDQLVRRHRLQMSHAGCLPTTGQTVSMASLPAVMHVTEHKPPATPEPPIAAPRRSMSAGPRPRGIHGTEASEIATAGATGTTSVAHSMHDEGMVSPPAYGMPFVVVQPRVSTAPRSPGGAFDA